MHCTQYARGWPAYQGYLMQWDASAKILATTGDNLTDAHESGVRFSCYSVSLPLKSGVPVAALAAAPEASCCSSLLMAESHSSLGIPLYGQ